MSVSLSYRLVSQDLPRSLERVANQPQVEREVEYYLANARAVTSIDDFLADTRLFRTAMTAFGLEDLAYAKGYVRKILEGGVSDPQSLANRTTDVRLRDFARAFDFESFGDLTMRRPATGQAVVDAYVRQTLELQAGQENEGVRLALYFQRQAPGITSMYEVLADAALSKVVRTALGLPDEFAAADIDKQAASLSARIDLADWQDPAEVQQFLTRFTANWDRTQGAASDPILALFNRGSSSGTASLNLAMTLNSLRLGGG